VKAACHPPPHLHLHPALPRGRSRKKKTGHQREGKPAPMTGRFVLVPLLAQVFHLANIISQANAFVKPTQSHGWRGFQSFGIFRRGSIFKSPGRVFF
jgi:hypothetical protein